MADNPQNPGKADLSLTGYAPILGSGVVPGAGSIALSGGALSARINLHKVTEDIEASETLNPWLEATMTVVESYEGSETVTDKPVVWTYETNDVSEVLSTQLTTANEVLAEAVEVTEFVRILFSKLIQENVDISEVVTGDFLLEIAEALVVSEVVATTITGYNLATATCYAADQATKFFKEELTEGVDITEALTAYYQASLSITEGVDLTSAASQFMTVAVLVEEDVNISETVTSPVELLELITENLGAAVFIKLGDEVYQAWVVNTETAGVTEYRNYPFNSFFEEEGRYFGVSDDGIYELTGDTDEGDAIRAYIRTGFMNFGSIQEKYIDSFFLVYTGDGQLLAKAIITEEGERVEQWYTLRQIDSGPTVERGQGAKGLISTHFEFEITNIEGADFNLQECRVFPVLLGWRS